MQKAENNGGHISVSYLMENLGWDTERTQRAFDRLIIDGLAWIDTQTTDNETLYWIPSIFSAIMGAS